MQPSMTGAIRNSVSVATSATPVINGRRDLELANALQKVSPEAKAKAKSTAQDFEAMFLNSMFSQMTNGLQGDGPFEFDVVGLVDLAHAALAEHAEDAVVGDLFRFVNDWIESRGARRRGTSRGRRARGDPQRRQARL